MTACLTVVVPKSKSLLSIAIQNRGHLFRVPWTDGKAFFNWREVYWDGEIQQKFTIWGRGTCAVRVGENFVLRLCWRRIRNIEQGDVSQEERKRPRLASDADWKRRPNFQESSSDAIVEWRRSPGSGKFQRSKSAALIRVEKSDRLRAVSSKIAAWGTSWTWSLTFTVNVNVSGKSPRDHPLVRFFSWNKIRDKRISVCSDICFWVRKFWLFFA